jgi:hypothetical protein
MSRLSIPVMRDLSDLKKQGFGFSRESRQPPLIAYPVGRAKFEGSVIGRAKRSVGEFFDCLL